MKGSVLPGANSLGSLCSWMADFMSWARGRLPGFLYFAGRMRMAAPPPETSLQLEAG